MKNKCEIDIDEAKVERSIERFIQNEGEDIYVEAPSLKSVTDNLYGREMDKQYREPIILPSIVSNALISKPPTIMTALHLPEMVRIKFRTEYQLEKIGMEAHYFITPLSRIWSTARYWGKNPLKGLKKVCFWNWGAQKSLDKQFKKNLQTAYQWLQEERPLEQCDLKNMHAILGLYLLNKYNEAPTTTQKAPLDEVVAKQVRRVPNEIIENLGGRGKKGEIKLVNGKTIVNINCTLGELYANQLQQVT